LFFKSKKEFQIRTYKRNGKKKNTQKGRTSMENSKKLAITSVVTHKASDLHEKQSFAYNTQFHSKKNWSTMYFGSGPVLAEQVLQFSVPGLVAVAS